VPPLLTDESRWLRLAVDPSNDPLMRTGNAYATIFLAHDRREVAFRVDTVRQKIAVVSFNNSKLKAEWSYTRPDERHLALVTDGDSLRVTLRRVDLEGMPWRRRQRSGP